MDSMLMPTFPYTSSFGDKWKYDVFLNFRGEDTRAGFTGNLYYALSQRGINTFIDDENLRKGEEITPSLMKAISESRIAIVVFSENYASSKFCLEELVMIMNCIKHSGRFVYPIFYHVDPRDVRYQTGSYKEALAKHESRITDKEKVKRWRLALQEASNLSGLHIKLQDGYEYEFIRKIIQEVSKRINRSTLHVATYPIGLKSRVFKVNSLLDLESDDGVRMLGIWGIGGIGKTTLACAIYNSIAHQFESHCFLANIRENSKKRGLEQLQEKLLSQLTGDDDSDLMFVNRGIHIIKSRLCGKKVLLILDDVDKLEQLRALAGRDDWFGSGSRIIIITRDKSLLHSHDVKTTYEVEGLNHREATELFSWCAFKKKEVDPGYMDIAKKIVFYSDGHPLCLEVIGSNLYGKTVWDWEFALETYEGIPHENIQGILKVSYDGLTESQKEAFLDLACFHKGQYPTSNLRYILHIVHGVALDYDIKVLTEKCLIKVYGYSVTMHDLIEDMGKEIVRKESPINPWERSRLWFYKDILRVLKKNKGSENTEIIILYPPEYKMVQWDGDALTKMENLKILVVVNTGFSRGPNHLPESLRALVWRGYPESSLPDNFDPKKLIFLELSDGCFSFDNKKIMKFKSLTLMRLTGCQSLKQVPDLSGSPNLKYLYLDYCLNLVEVHDSIGFHNKLELLSLHHCTSLKVLPRGIKSTSLESLSLGYCTSLESFPEILGKTENIRYVDLSNSAIRELPISFGNLEGLEKLALDGCRMLHELPSCIFMLPRLMTVGAINCEGLAQVKEVIDQEQETISSNVRDAGPFKSGMYACFDRCYMKDEVFATLLPYLHNVTRLILSHNDITILPSCISACRYLRRLVLNGCKELREIRGLPPNIKYLSALNCISLTSQSKGMMLAQVLLNTGPACFCFPEPGCTIQSLFNHGSREPSLSFWFRGKFPSMTLGVFGVSDSLFQTELGLFINGQQELNNYIYFTTSNDLVQVNHIALYNLEHEFLSHKSETLFTMDEWNHAKISLGKNVKAADIEWMGVHVKDQITSMVDFRFFQKKILWRLNRSRKVVIRRFNRSRKVVTSSLE